MTKKRKANGGPNGAATKRPRAHLDDDDDAESTAFQRRFGGSKPRIDAQHGQRGALPLDDGPLDDEFYEPANEGLEYLRMVRTQARDVPRILVAPKTAAEDEEQDPYTDPYKDWRGYYSDGAYVAAPVLDLSASRGYSTTAGRQEVVYDENGELLEEYREDEPIDPQDAYYARLLDRFVAHRQHLRAPPPASAIAALDSAHPISFPSRFPARKAAAQEWRRLLATTEPLPAQLAAMDTEVVLELLKMLRGVLRRGQQVERRTGAWVWGLLGRLPEVEVLGSMDVGVVRDLAKRADDVRRAWREGGKMGERDERDGGKLGEEVGEVEVCGEDEGNGKSEDAEVEEDYHEDDGEGIDVRGDFQDPSTSTALVTGCDVVNPGQSDPTPSAGADNGQVATPPETKQRAPAIDPAPGTDPSRKETTPSPSETPSKSEAHQPNDPDSTRPSSSVAETSQDALQAAKARLLASLASADEIDTPSFNAGRDRNAEQNGKVQERQEDQDDESSGPSPTTLATLDMIITIAGEMYGQRDLLEHREIWGEYDDRG